MSKRKIVDLGSLHDTMVENAVRDDWLARETGKQPVRCYVFEFEKHGRLEFKHEEYKQLRTLPREEDYKNENPAKDEFKLIDLTDEVEPIYLDDEKGLKFDVAYWSKHW